MGILGASAAFAGDMSFRIARLNAPACGVKCPEIVVADGVIESDTPDRFVEFVRAAGSARPVRSVVLINSPGGNVVAAMELGVIFRKLHVAAIVAGYASSGAYSGPVSGKCASACVYAFMGAVSRVAPPESRVTLHRMSAPTGYMPSGRDHARAPSARYADSRLVSLVAAYARRMGVDPAVVVKAESWSVDSPYNLSPGEIARWRLASARL